MKNNTILPVQALLSISFDVDLFRLMPVRPPNMIDKPSDNLLAGDQLVLIWIINPLHMISSTLNYSAPCF